MSGSANAETTAERHQMRAKDLDREVRALASAPGHVCFSLTEDLHGCRSAFLMFETADNEVPMCEMCAQLSPTRQRESHRGEFKHPVFFPVFTFAHLACCFSDIQRGAGCRERSLL